MNSLEPVIKNFKNYVNKNFKMIGFAVTNNKVVFNECKDDIVTFKFLCDDQCKCETLLQIFRGFTQSAEPNWCVVALITSLSSRHSWPQGPE